MEVFKVVREQINVWNAEPLEAADHKLDDTLAQDLFKSMRNQEAALAEALVNFKEAQAAFEDELDFVKPFIDKNEDIVRLNVLGSPVDVSRTVIRMHEESMLSTIFESSKWQSQPQNLDNTGRYLLVSRMKCCAFRHLVSHTHAYIRAHTCHLHAQEVSSYAFRKLVDVLRLRTLYQIEDATVPVRDNDGDDFNHMLSYLYPGCEKLVATISSSNKMGGESKDEAFYFDDGGY